MKSSLVIYNHIRNVYDKDDNHLLTRVRSFKSYEDALQSHKDHITLSDVTMMDTRNESSCTLYIIGGGHEVLTIQQVVIA